MEAGEGAPVAGANREGSRKEELGTKQLLPSRRASRGIANLGAKNSPPQTLIKALRYFGLQAAELPQLASPHQCLKMLISLCSSILDDHLR